MPNITINTEYIRSWNGIFKMLQLLFGTICVGLIGSEFDNAISYSDFSRCFFLIVTCTFYIGTFILFISYFISPSAASIIPKTIYELIYHAVAAVLLIASTIALMVQIHKKSDVASIIAKTYNTLLASSIFALINTILYILSAIMGFGTYGDD
ncbi:hypothetical protein PUN28_015007 [Cardiocondyla obscurior]|uniref:MARVEL domain-containing protein n=1 Tax=Cardiocondyla obscurior TaxID=286306 RepID=A0AAW2EXQ1_9HYME